MKLSVGIVIVLVAAAIGLLYTCEPRATDSAPGEPNDLHPNSTSPDEQGESGSLIEHKSK